MILLQSATLTNGVESKNSSGDNSGSSNSSDDSSDDDEDKFKRLTDEELFKACGGLTAHKYGFSLSDFCSSYLTIYIIRVTLITEFDTIWLSRVFAKTTCLNLMISFAHESPLTRVENDAPYNLTVPCFMYPRKVEVKVV